MASALGYTVKTIGAYHTLKEMDSIRIYNRTNWFRWSRAYETGENGGSQIDFLRVFVGLEVVDAVAWLLDFVGYKETSRREFKLKHQIEKSPTVKRKDFVLAEAATSSNYLYSYLMGERGLDKRTIDYFIEKDLIYEAKAYHNIVFKGKDKDGLTRFASMRGVFDKDGKSFRCDIAGSDKSYGFNVRNEASKEVIVFEAAIDLMSYVEIFNDYESNKLALGMTFDGPLERFLLENPHIKKIRFCLDNDEAGRKAVEFYLDKYKKKGKDVEFLMPGGGQKDFNEWLKMKKSKKFIKEKSDVTFSTQKLKVR